ANVAAAELDLRRDIAEALADAEATLAQLTAVQRRADLEKDNVRRAKRYYDIVFEEYKRGYKNSGDLSSAADTWSEAEVRQKELDFEFIKTKVDLQRRLGAVVP